MGAAIPALIGTLGPKVFDFITNILGKSKLSAEQQAAVQMEVLKNQAELSKIEADSATRAIEAVNATMQAEAKSDAWYQKGWRPFIGFTFGFTILNNYVLLPYFRPRGLLPIDIPGEVWSAMLVILGVTAGLRGLKQWQATKNGNGNGK